VWKDIVEYKFRKLGLSRPKHLLYPYPVLIQHLQESGRALNATLLQVEGNTSQAIQAIRFIEETPMDLLLLKDSGIGKTVKKFLHKSSRLDFLDEPYVFSTGKDIRKTPRTTLQSTLQEWMNLAATQGVKMKNESSAERGPASSSSSSTNSNKSNSVDLSSTRKCTTWRELYQTLQVQDEERKCRQGEKMRERRQRLDSVRPKIVKVRHASAKQDRLLGRASFGSGYHPSQQQTQPVGNSKIRQLKMEATITSTRRRPPPPVEASRGGGGFGAAVAFAAIGSKAATKRKAPPSTKSVELAGGKRIKVPDMKRTASVNVQKRLNMLKKGQTSFRK
jgi:hypothetical protein